MKHHGWSFVRAARAAGMQNSTQMRDMLARHKKLAEGRVPFVLKRWRQDNLCIACETKRTGPAAFIGNDEAAHFDIVARSHACLHAQFDAMVTAVELGKMRMKDHAIFVRHGPCRLPRRRPQVSGLVIGDIYPDAVGVARRIGHQPRQCLPAPAQATAPAVGNPARKPSIAEQQNLREWRGGFRRPGTQRSSAPGRRYRPVQLLQTFNFGRQFGWEALA